MSVSTSASTAAKIAVIVPIVSTTSIAASLAANSGNIRATRYTPAVTIVAAWISALTGVGPSIASGSQTCSGNCPDLPIAPRNISTAASVIVPAGISPAVSISKIWSISKLPVALNSTRMPISSPTSPIRVVTKAFLAASRAEGRSHQYPINRYEQSPTSSQETYRMIRLFASTSPSIAAVNSATTAKNQ